MSSLFTPQQTQTPPPQPQPQAQPSAPRPQLAAYSAYEKNGLKITLTPQTNPAKPGYINILARFQVMGASAANGLSFQAAVPKVSVTPPLSAFRT
jgi:AP-1 complex subunit gamma-1